VNDFIFPLWTVLFFGWDNAIAPAKSLPSIQQGETPRSRKVNCTHRYQLYLLNPFWVSNNIIMIRSPSAKKILVPCDGSKPSANALEKATELFMPAGDGANINQTEIILLYTVPYIIYKKRDIVVTPWDVCLALQSDPLRESQLIRAGYLQARKICPHCGGDIDQ
jgi:hypothetical protein